MSVRAKLFMNGRSQAVRLPKEFRMPGTEVKVSRDGDKVILEPLARSVEEIDLWLARLRALQSEDFLAGFDPDAEPMGVDDEVSFDFDDVKPSA